MTEPSFKSDFLRTLSARGFIHQCTDMDALDTLAKSGMITAYIGFDATAPSLHAGSLVQIMMLRWLQKTGHKPIVLMGGGTTKVGDPSGKDTSRQMLDDARINENLNGIKQVFSKFVDFGDGESKVGGNQAIMVNNDDWLSGYGYIEFLRLFGTHFTINRMMTFDSVKTRLEREQPLTFLEFNYMLMQAVDFRELNTRHDCILQMGGSDQWGNIVNGVELTRRMSAKAAFGLTTPLLATSSGAKMGKTASGAVWLNADMLSPYDYWQYWRNAEDKDVGRFLRLFTELPLDEIKRLEALEGSEINDAKKVLADEATKMLHGADAAATARDTAQKAFEQGVLSADLPTVEMDWKEGDKYPLGLRTAEALVVGAGLARSNREARDLIGGGGIQINDEKPVLPRSYSADEALEEFGAFKVQKGRKTIVLLKPM